MYHQFSNVGFIETKLSKETMDRLRSYITRDRKVKDIRGSLAGNISESCSLTDTDNWFFNKDLGPLIDVFLKNTDGNLKIVPHVLNKDCHFKLHAFWSNFQKKYEFNPIHQHDGVFSFVVWMKIPASYKEEIKLPFVNGANGMCPNTFQLSYITTTGKVMSEQWNLEPEDEGTIVFFDSARLHQVYPFYTSDEERISISGNIHLDVDRVVERK